MAADPRSVRLPGFKGRTLVEGVRDGVGITVVVGSDGRIVTAFPNNIPRNPK